MDVERCHKASSQPTNGPEEIAAAPPAAAGPGEHPVFSEPAWLLVDLTHHKSLEALKLLHEAGLVVTDLPVSPLLEPRLKLGGRTYRGIEAIKQLIDSLQEHLQSSE